MKLGGGVVNIAELLTVTAMNRDGTGEFVVDIVPLDKHKRFVMDPKAMETMNEQITSKCRVLEARDPRTRLYIEEMVSRLITELNRVGLCQIEDVPEMEDPYKAIRQKFHSR